MAAATGTNDRRFCWEQVLRTNRIFRISQVFAPADRTTQLLPLYALFSAVEEIGFEYSDESIARHKIDWWRNECSRLGAQGSDHPILRELSTRVAHQALDQDNLARLFDDAESRLDAVAPADHHQLRNLCAGLTRPQIALELSLCGGEPPPAEVIDVIGAEIGLAQLLRESVRCLPSRRYWWLPMNLLARHGLTRGDIANDSPAVPVRALFADLLKETSLWRTNGNSRVRAAWLSEPAARHLFVIGRLQADALRRLGRRRPDQFAKELNRVGMPQLLQAWKAARLTSPSHP